MDQDSTDIDDELMVGSLEGDLHLPWWIWGALIMTLPVCILMAVFFWLFDRLFDRFSK